MKKDIKFSTRMASTDRETIRLLAEKAKMSMSDYVTACCSGKQITIVDGLKETLSELRSIGNNLNQLTTLAHLGRIQTVSLERAANELAGLRLAVSDLTKKGGG